MDVDLATITEHDAQVGVVCIVVPSLERQHHFKGRRARDAYLEVSMLMFATFFWKDKVWRLVVCWCR